MKEENTVRRLRQIEVFLEAEAKSQKRTPLPTLPEVPNMRGR